MATRIIKVDVEVDVLVCGRCGREYVPRVIRAELFSTDVEAAPGKPLRATSWTRPEDWFEVNLDKIGYCATDRGYACSDCAPAMRAAFDAALGRST